MVIQQNVMLPEPVLHYLAVNQRLQFWIETITLNGTIEPRCEKTGFLLMRKTKTQISCAVTAQLISAFVFAIRIINPSTNYFRNFQPLAIFCGCTDRFVSDLVGNPEDRFSHKEALLILTVNQANTAVNSLSCQLTASLSVTQA